MRWLLCLIMLGLAQCNLYRDQVGYCDYQFADCTGNCGDQVRFDVPVAPTCIDQCLQNLSVCVRRARQ